MEINMQLVRAVASATAGIKLEIKNLTVAATAAIGTLEINDFAAIRVVVDADFDHVYCWAVRREVRDDHRQPGKREYAEVNPIAPHFKEIIARVLYLEIEVKFVGTSGWVAVAWIKYHVKYLTIAAASAGWSWELKDCTAVRVVVDTYFYDVAGIAIRRHRWNCERQGAEQVATIINVVHPYFKEVIARVIYLKIKSKRISKRSRVAVAGRDGQIINVAVAAIQAIRYWELDFGATGA